MTNVLNFILLLCVSQPEACPPASRAFYASYKTPIARFSHRTERHIARLTKPELALLVVSTAQIAAGCKTMPLAPHSSLSLELCGAFEQKLTISYTYSF